jgi:hypothetical protein
MRPMRWALMAVTAALAAGCGSVVIVAAPNGDGGAGDAPVAIDQPPADAPRVCRTTGDCGPGEECLVREGCAVPSVCGPALGRPCTGDLVPYCGCDGVTFEASSSCPTQNFAFRGPCEAMEGGTPPPPPGAGCRLPNGQACPVGSRCPAPDGCNVCVCARDGTLTCTERACIDAGMPVCNLPSGETCPVGARCPIDRCTVCACVTPGRLMCGNICPDAGPPTDVPSPRSCRTEGDCPAGTFCDGPPGCGVPWRCVAARPCTDDLAPFCGCDGVTFRSSSTCPGQPFRSRGACPSGDAGTPECAPQDARGEGLCGAFFGFAWDGRVCVGISGCRCVGADCRGLAGDPDACRLRYARCG